MTHDFEALASLCANLRWAWHSPTRELLDTIPGAVAGRHPVADLRAAAPAALTMWLGEHRDEVQARYAELAEIVASVGPPEIAYFSPEFGIAAELPQYSGGLGILAGDHLKAASDIGLPLVGVGLFYRGGFFRQGITDHHQTESYPVVDPELVGAIDTGVTVSVPVGDVEIDAKVWRQMVGATTLLLLDTDLPGNPEWGRAITDRLYSGDRKHRVHQELVLGVGGTRALRALRIAPGAFHLNEGHACFLLLELLGEELAAGATIDAAKKAVRSQTLFTTHTPVPAGIDRFSLDLVEAELGPWIERIGLDFATVAEWAHIPNDTAGEPFNTAALAFELCDRANGVSQLHATVSRELFAGVPRAARVEGITNGVHARTWVSPDIQAFFDAQLGAGWENGDAAAWERITSADPGDLLTARRQGRLALVERVAASTGVRLDPDRPVIGFARRFATYKRAALLLRDPEGLQRSLAAGAQFVFAGKAHPADAEGKAVLSQVSAFAASPGAMGRFALVPDYDIDIAQSLYSGCDVWLNNPIRPHEACGTSGEKAALNGGLNCSILDGWWADWFVEGIGWAIPTSDAVDPVERDTAEAAALHELITGEVLPTFGDDDRWWATASAMLAHLGPRVTAGRMVAEYDERFYRPIRQR